MPEIKDAVFRKMLDKAGLQDVHLFRRGKMILTKKGENYISGNEMKFSDITKGQWVKTIKYWIESAEKFNKEK